MRRAVVSGLLVLGGAAAVSVAATPTPAAAVDRCPRGTATLAVSSEVRVYTPDYGETRVCSRNSGRVILAGGNNAGFPEKPAVGAAFRRWGASNARVCGEGREGCYHPVYLVDVRTGRTDSAVLTIDDPKCGIELGGDCAVTAQDIAVGRRGADGLDCVRLRRD